MTGEASLGLPGLFFGETVASMARIALTVLTADGMAAPAPFLSVDHLRREFQDLLEFIDRSPCLGMLPRFEPFHLNRMASLTDAANHQARSDHILGRFMVAAVTVYAGNPGLAHSAFTPG
jgi:hypothetical protein